jgi:hypothetical protein
MAENPTREGVGAFGLLIRGLPDGILLDDGDAMHNEAADAAAAGNGDRSKSCEEVKINSRCGGHFASHRICLRTISY